jgi:H-type lectin domain
LYDRNYTGDVLDSVEIPFDKEFKDAPKLVMGLVKVDAGAGLKQLPGGHGIVRLEVFAEVTRKGFTLRFKTWDESRLDNAAVSWMAIGR